jgi:hypothetical protein
MAVAYASWIIGVLIAASWSGIITNAPSVSIDGIHVPRATAMFWYFVPLSRSPSSESSAAWVTTPRGIDCGQKYSVNDPLFTNGFTPSGKAFR